MSIGSGDDIDNDRDSNDYVDVTGNGRPDPGDYNPLTAGEVVCTILSISENFPITGTTGADIYEVRAEQTAALFKYKFVRKF